MNPEEPCVQSMLPVRLPVALTVPSGKLYAEKPFRVLKSYTHDGEVCPAKWKKGESTLKPSIDLVGKI